MRAILVLFFFLLGGNEGDLYPECESKVDTLNKISSICDRIDYVYNCKSDFCFVSFFNALEASTGISSHMTAGTDGIYYLTDSIREVDFRKWNEKCNCSK